MSTFVDVHELAEEHAHRVLATLDGADAETLRALWSAFEVAGHPLTHLSNPIFSLSLHREDDEEPGFVCLLQTRAALRSLAYHPRFIDRLEGIEHPFWSTLRTALVEIADARPPAAADPPLAPVRSSD